MSHPESPPSQATTKERFDLLYVRVKSVHDIFIDVVFKATAALLLVAGWVVTSDTALAHMKRDPATRWLAILALIVYAALFTLAAYRTARSSARLADLLASLDYMPSEDYRDILVPPAVTLSFAAANACFCTAIAVFIYRVTT